MRKEQNDFGWDWSPSIAPVGPWQDARVVQLTGPGSVHVQNVMFDIYRRGQMNNLPPDQSQPWIFNASIDYIGTLEQPRMELTLKNKHKKTVKKSLLGNLTWNKNTVTGSMEINEPVDLWWPNELGEQSLYEATVTISDSRSKTHYQYTSVTRRVGFRTIVLNGTPISEVQMAKGIAGGSNWHFEINGREFFAKGANLVPPEVFWSQVTEAQIKELFGLAKSGHYNMLRVWSSGVYLPDWIYDIADEMGILLWSEFQFTDAIYPDTPDYLANYEAEAYYNVRRVNHHPSLALWAGGNELEAIILAFFFYPGPVLDAYEKVFEELLIKCVYANSRSISYIPSSTYNGYLGEINFDSARPQTPRYGNVSTPGEYYSDVDTYNYDASQGFDLSKYPVGRFVNEFGFISMPSAQTWSKAIAKDQMSFLSPAVLHHNRHLGGGFGFNGSHEEGIRLGVLEMSTAVDLWYPRPNLADPVANFTTWCYATQVYHADYYSSIIASFRRGSGKPERTLGSLFWQLNDLWAAPTWAAIEHDNRPKLTYYATKSIYSPVIVRPYYDQKTGELEVWVTSDRMSSVSGTVSLKWIDYEGKHLESIPKPDKGDWDLRFDLGAVNSTLTSKYSNISSLFAKTRGVSASNALLQMSVKAGEYTHVSYFHPTSLKNADLKDPVIKLQHLGGNRFKVTATKAVAAWVWLEVPSSVRGAFDDNAFWLVKGQSKTVSFDMWDNVSGGTRWSKQVTVRSLWSNLDE